MFSRLNPFRPPEHAVLSLEVQARLPDVKVQGRFEVLVRHLLNRFFNNDLMSSDGESTRAVQLGYLVALPGLLFALFLFPSYHAFPPIMEKRTFWPQVSDHYFYVMYSMVVMGVVTVYEWDLLFPDLLDVFVLSVLPIKDRRLFLARVVALVIFLGMVLLGTNFLGAIFLPMVADLPSLLVHLFAHAVAVVMAGSFAAGFFLMLQGVLLNLLGERIFRRITPLLQGASITILLTVLFLFPALSRFLQALLGSGSLAVRYFPPFWFLGIYERLLSGSSTMPILKELAGTGCWATLLVVSLVIVTYPLAYKRKVRQLVEGSSATTMKGWKAKPINALWHATVLRLPARRATFHFIGQSLLRTQKHRVMLAMYGGLGFAIAAADMVFFTIDGHHVRVGFLADGVRAAIPVLVFWTVAGLRTTLAAPMDRRSGWVFRVIIGRATLEHLNGAKIWVTAWALVISTATLAFLPAIAPSALRAPLTIAAQIGVAIGLSLVLTDVLFLKSVAIPFTELRRNSFMDLPMIVIRYIVVFPILVLFAMHFEVWAGTSSKHLMEMALLVAAAHLGCRWIYARRVREMRMGSEFEDAHQLFQGLGLTD